MAMSLEEFAEKYGRYPSADWFIGQRVERVNAAPDGSWTIHFEDGGKIVNYDPLVLFPTAIQGAALTQVVMTNKLTELRFGLEVVKLNPLQWSMLEPNLTLGEMVFAQRSKFNMPREVKGGT